MALPVSKWSDVSPSTRNSIVENQIASLVLPLGWPNVACKTIHEFGDPFTGIPVHVKRSIHSPVRLILLLCTLFFRGYGLDTDPFDTGVVHQRSQGLANVFLLDQRHLLDCGHQDDIWALHAPVLLV